MDAEAILRISRPEWLFCLGKTPTEKEISKEFRDLSKLWHPDKHRGDAQAEEVFKRIGELHREALKRLAAGEWRVPGQLEIRSGKKKLLVNYRGERKFELGAIYVGDTVVVYEVEEDFRDIALRWPTAKFSYANDAMEKDISRYLPVVREIIKANNGKTYFLITKTPDLLLLADVIDYYKKMGAKGVEKEHVAWIMNTLLNLECYLEYAKITHNAISGESYFISPVYHSGALFGGWWFSAQVGGRMVALPNRTHSIIPPDVLREKAASIRTDLELIKALGREMLGDVRTNPEAKVIRPMAHWLSLPSRENAVQEYKEWRDVVLPSVFGARRFVKMDLSASDIYDSPN